MWALKYWKYLAIAILALMIIFAGIWIRSLQSELAEQARLRQQAEVNYAACTEDKKLMAASSKEYQDRSTALRNELASIKRLRGQGKCYPIQRTARPVKPMLPG